MSQKVLITQPTSQWESLGTSEIPHDTLTHVNTNNIKDKHWHTCSCMSDPFTPQWLRGHFRCYSLAVSHTDVFEHLCFSVYVSVCLSVPHESLCLCLSVFLHCSKCVCIWIMIHKSSWQVCHDKTRRSKTRLMSHYMSLHNKPSVNMSLHSTPMQITVHQSQVSNPVVANGALRVLLKVC